MKRVSVFFQKADHPWLDITKGPCQILFLKELVQGLTRNLCTGIQRNGLSYTTYVTMSNGFYHSVVGARNVARSSAVGRGGTSRELTGRLHHHPSANTLVHMTKQGPPVLGSPCLRYLRCTPFLHRMARNRVRCVLR